MKGLCGIFVFQTALQLPILENNVHLSGQSDGSVLGPEQTLLKSYKCQSTILALQLLQLVILLLHHPGLCASCATEPACHQDIAWRAVRASA